MKNKVSAFIVFYVLWIVLAGWHIQELIVGAIISALLALTVGSLIRYKLHPKDLGTVIKYVILFLPLFIWKLIQANIQMARIVLSPSLPIQPGFVVIQTDLKKDIAKLSLANAITLTPGTLSIDVNDDELLIHWVKVQGEDSQAHREGIAGAFEKALGGIFK